MINIFAAVNESVLEVIVYVFLGGGAIAIIGLIAYAIAVFRRVAAATEAATTVLLRTVDLLDCGCQTLAAVETKLSIEQPPTCSLNIARLDALDRVMTRAQAPQAEPKEEPKGACPKCGGAFTWPPKGSVLSESSVVLTMACGQCGKLTDVATGERT